MRRSGYAAAGAVLFRVVCWRVSFLFACLVFSNWKIIIFPSVTRAFTIHKGGDGTFFNKCLETFRKKEPVY